jgi:hypothetical protein
VCKFTSENVTSSLRNTSSSPSLARGMLFDSFLFGHDVALVLFLGEQRKIWVIKRKSSFRYLSSIMPTLSLLYSSFSIHLVGFKFQLEECSVKIDYVLDLAGFEL